MSTRCWCTHAPPKTLLSPPGTSHRREVMYDDFVLIGPADDRAAHWKARRGRGRSPDRRSRASLAVRRLRPPSTELTLWEQAGVAASARADSWYIMARTGHGRHLDHGQRACLSSPTAPVGDLRQQRRFGLVVRWRPGVVQSIQVSCRSCQGWSPMSMRRRRHLTHLVAVGPGHQADQRIHRQRHPRFSPSMVDKGR